MRLRATTAVMLALAAGLAACGGDDEPEGDPIPAASAGELQKRLDEIERRYDFGGGACADITNDSEPAVRNILASLPQSVDPEVRSALDQSFDRLFQMTAADCDTEKGAATEPETTPELPPETETETTIDTDTIPTETLPPETTPEPPPETTPEDPTEEPPVDPDQGLGGGAEAPEDGQ